MSLSAKRERLHSKFCEKYSVVVYTCVVQREVSFVFELGVFGLYIPPLEEAGQEHRP